MSNIVAVESSTDVDIGVIRYRNHKPSICPSTGKSFYSCGNYLPREFSGAKAVQNDA